MIQQLWTFVASYQAELWAKLWQHLYLVGISTTIAIAVGIPLGIWILRAPRLKHPILSSASVLQTIPSLALLAFLLPFFGIGVKPALVALTLYALLPIIRNTLTGLESVPDELLEAARGLGFTLRQRLWLVELPLSLPMIVAGIRTSAVIGVGIATLAAFIGAGGLGDFINQGLAMNNNRLILLGAIPAALLALTIDFLIGRVEKLLAKQRNSQQRRRFKQRVIVLLVIVLLVIVFGWVVSLRKQNNTVTVASKNFVESMILAEMMAEMIEQHTSLKVNRRFNLGSTRICHGAMVRGDVDMYPEYTGTAYLVVLHKTYDRPYTAAELFNRVKQAYWQQFHFVWLPSFGFENTQALILRQQFAKRHHLTTISDLLPLQNSMTLGAPSEFLQRPDGVPGLKRVYGLHFKTVKEMDIGLMYQAIHEQQVQAIAGFSTDGRIIAYQLMVLKDNKHLFPPYYAAPVIRGDTLKQHPEISKALAPLAHRLTASAMQRLNYLVDLKHIPPQQVAHQYLLNNSLIKKT